MPEQKIDDDLLQEEQLALGSENLNSVLASESFIFSQVVNTYDLDPALLGISIPKTENEFVTYLQAMENVLHKEKKLTSQGWITKNFLGWWELKIRWEISYFQVGWLVPDMNLREYKNLVL